MSLDEDFRTLVFKYGISNVIEYAENFVKQSYEEINKIHTRLFVKQTVEAQKVIVVSEKKVEEPVVNDNKQVENEVVQNEETEPVEESVKKPKKILKKVKNADVKQEEKVEEPAKEKTAAEPEESTIGNDDEVGDTDEDDDAEEKKRKEEEKRERNRIAKQKQTDAQRKTFEKNKATGINPYDMLTKENLEKWLIKEARTYADIAKNIVGCADKEVSLAAKRFEVKSLYMGENGMIKAGRKKKATSE
jgi:outer membrane biosynthesis protein TonB